MTFNRSFGFFCAGAMLICFSGQTCNVGSGLMGGRDAPVIIPAGATEDSFSMSFSVDLRDYPEAAMVSWNFGDGGTSPSMMVSKGTTISHSFPSAGTYTVVVHVFDGGDAINHKSSALIGTGTLPVTVLGPNANPIASFRMTDITDADGSVSLLAKRFSAAASNDPDGSIVDYSWDFGDGSTGNGMTLEHGFSVGGIYPVQLTVTDNRGGTDTFSLNAAVTIPPVASFTFSVDPIDLRTVTFDASSSNDPDGSIISFAWTFGDRQTGNGMQITHTYSNPGTFQVVLTVTDNTNATGTIQQSVHAPGRTFFVNSVTPTFGVVDTLQEVDIIGENFLPTDMTVRLLHANTPINAPSYTFISETEIKATFDLHGATPQDYDVIVGSRGDHVGRLQNGFRVVTTNHVRLSTTMGDIVFELVPDAPITTQNFLQYVQDKFYDGTIIHRVVPSFVIQGGGFLPGMIPQTGIRGPIQNEFSPTRSNVRGTVAMAKVGNDPNSATSQWFVNLVDNSSNLDSQNGGFTVFANVIAGMDVVDAIAGVPIGSNDQPVTDVIVNTARRE
jgi:cyclophilin family peptidyl-prolyl cis-trans isomerase/chitodextrinase